jgi:hypothetical protein
MALDAQTVGVVASLLAAVLAGWTRLALAEIRAAIAQARAELTREAEQRCGECAPARQLPELSTRLARLEGVTEGAQHHG